MTRLVPASSTVYTPRDLAEAMVHRLLDEKGARWLDPCVGDGVFVGAMANAGIESERITAIDRSRRRGLHDDDAKTIRGVDFLAWSAERRAEYDRVVMNPPYVRIGRLRGKPRKLATMPRLHDGGQIPLTANYWCSFVVAAANLVRHGGALAAVLPAAWDFAVYSSLARAHVEALFEKVTVLRSSQPLFNTVRDGAVVIIAESRGSPAKTIERFEVDDLDEMLRALRRDRVRAAATTTRILVPSSDPVRRVALKDVLKIRIGAVTGDARYFLLSDSERIGLGLPRTSVRPVLTRARQLRQAFIDDEEWQMLLAQDERVWLFRPTGSALHHDAVKEYLRAGEKLACKVEGYKVSGRRLWHRTPLPPKVHGFISGMSRRLPFIVLNGKSGLTATNTLYVVSFNDGIDDDTKQAVALGLLSSEARKSMRRHASVYADGLEKLEPRTLASTSVPVVIGPGIGARLEAATSALVAGRASDAEAIADEWIAKQAQGVAPMRDVDAERMRAKATSE